MADGTFSPHDVTDVCQRWRGGRASYRPAGEPIDTARHGVDGIAKDTPAKAFVEAHHYSHRFVAARVRAGLYAGGELVGCCVFSVPGQKATIPHYVRCLDSRTPTGVVLGRLVLLDDVPANGESWFVARALRLLKAEKPELDAVVSYSDPVVRTSAAGALVMPGHVGTVYQALNAAYVGRSRKETVALDAGGRVVDRRALSKIRNDESGAGYAYEHLLSVGAPRRRPLEDGAVYVKRALREGPFRAFRHPGNHVYVWTLKPDVVVIREHDEETGAEIVPPYPKASRP